MAARLALEEAETLHYGEVAAIRDCDEVAEVTRLALVEESLDCGGLETWKKMTLTTVLSVFRFHIA